VSTEQYAELAELAGGFIHEIKNHLGTLKLNLQLLAEEFAEPQNQRERRALDRARKLEKECEHLVEVSNDFLRFARVGVLDLKPTDLGPLLEELLDFFGPMARAHHIEIKTFLPADLPPVLLDRDLFKQALLNLLLNAQQAMLDGGQLTIQAKLLENSHADSQSAIELSLIDTGKGMAPEVLTRAFRPFYSTRSGGSGLGLPTTRKIVLAHHGTIAVESDLGHGTKFTICLPLSAATKTAPEA
jgi:signal transduction histidine kinase